ncbi:Hypothetical protein, putative [Bodo saltans]|uniref:Uncharacterized protein n=1 Tax=Bodo saltans TaxID=75058 RepID=A0A0S4JJK6_BODSA|nr:Hypothetical protein, putative [Bodo saltans]|eukprot:CUG90743.1 Hypothetical protein, putative [Bodo saltans]
MMTFGPSDTAGIVAFGLYFAWQLYSRTQQRQRPNKESVEPVSSNCLTVGYEVPLTEGDHPLPRRVARGTELFTLTTSSSGIHQFSNARDDTLELHPSWAIGAAPAVNLAPTLSHTIATTEQILHDQAAQWMLEVEEIKAVRRDPCEAVVQHHGLVPVDAVYSQLCSNLDISSINSPFSMHAATGDKEEQVGSCLDVNVGGLARKRERHFSETYDSKNESEESCENVAEDSTLPPSSFRVKRRIERPLSLAALVTRSPQIHVIDRRFARRSGRLSFGTQEDATNARERRTRIVSEV